MVSCLLFAYQLSGNDMPHIIPFFLPFQLTCFLTAFIWCLLKTSFWKIKVSFIECIWDLIFKMNQFPSSFTSRRGKKKCCFLSEFDSSDFADFLDQSKHPVHTLARHNGVCHLSFSLFFFSIDVWLSCRSYWKLGEGALCVCCPLFFGLDVIT